MTCPKHCDSSADEAGVEHFGTRKPGGSARAFARGEKPVGSADAPQPIHGQPYPIIGGQTCPAMADRVKTRQLRPLHRWQVCVVRRRGERERSVDLIQTKVMVYK